MIRHNQASRRRRLWFTFVRPDKSHHSLAINVPAANNHCRCLFDAPNTFLLPGFLERLIFAWID
jgi:hypothetical protein